MRLGTGLTPTPGHVRGLVAALVPPALPAGMDADGHRGWRSRSRRQAPGYRALDIDGLSHRLQVAGPDTRPVETQMVNSEAFGNRPPEQLPGQPMGANGGHARAVTDPAADEAVAGRSPCSLPLPAVVADQDAGDELLDEGRSHHAAVDRTTGRVIALMGTPNNVAARLMSEGLAPRRPASMFDRWLGVTTSSLAHSASDQPSLRRIARNASGCSSVATPVNVATISNWCQQKG